MNEEGSGFEEGRSKSTRGKRRLMRRVVREKENGFVLDCLNQQKSKLKIYNSISDKYLNYFVIRVHPNRKNPKRVTKDTSQISRLEVKEQENHNRFQDMLLKQKAKLGDLSRCASTIPCTSRLSGGERGKLVKGPESQRVLLQEIKQSIKYKARQQTISQKAEEDKSFV